MLEIVSQLLILQDRDQKARSLQQQKTALPREAESLKKKLADREIHLKNAKAAALLVESERKKLDLDVQTLQQQIGKYRTQQNQTRKNEEYSALLHEISRAEEEIKSTEDRELELMEKYEVAKAEVAREAATFAEFEKGIQSQLAQLEHKLAAVTQQLVEALAAFQSARTGIDPGTLSRYDRLMTAKGDAAIVPMVHGNTCSGCHMTLTSQTILDCKGAQKSVSCENCGRFLYWPGD